MLFTFWARMRLLLYPPRVSAKLFLRCLSPLLASAIACGDGRTVFPNSEWEAARYPTPLRPRGPKLLLGKGLLLALKTLTLHAGVEL